MSAVYGDVTRELHSAWTKIEQKSGESRKDLKPGMSLNKVQIRTLFNELGLYPSEAQIFEMLRCARETSNNVAASSSTKVSPNYEGKRIRGLFQSQQSRTSPTSSTNSADFEVSSKAKRISKNSLTFGEFCLYATELKKYYFIHDNKRSSLTGSITVENNVNKDMTRNSLSSDVLEEKMVSSNTEGGAGGGLCCNNALSTMTNAGGESVSSSASTSSKLRTQKSSTSSYEVFLGGSCNPTTWRQDSAIPHLKRIGITYYNPQTSNWVPEMIELEHQAKQTANLLFFVLNEQTRNVVSMVEAAYLAGSGRRIIVVLSPYPESEDGHSINGESLSAIEHKELTSGLTTVKDAVERGGLPVFDDLSSALKCVAKVVKENKAIEDLGREDEASPVKLARLTVGDKLVRLREAFDTLDAGRNGVISMADLRLAFRIHTQKDLSQKELKKLAALHVKLTEESSTEEDTSQNNNNSSPSSSRKGSIPPLDQIQVDFDRFCCIVAEYKHSAFLAESTSSSHLQQPQDSSAGVANKKAKLETSKKPKQKKKSFLRRFCKIFNPHGKCKSNKNDDENLEENHHAMSRENSRKLTLANNANASSLSSSSTPMSLSLAPSSYNLMNGSMKASKKSVRSNPQERDVYLGGSVLNGSQGLPNVDGLWRDNLAIPLLKKHALTFYQNFRGRESENDELRRLMPLEATSADNSRFLLFVILASTRSAAAMTEAAYYVGTRKASEIVLCIQSIPNGEGQSPPVLAESGEVLSKAALKDYNRGRSYLSDIANREGVPVFEEISEAVECLLRKARNNEATVELMN